MSHLSPYNGLSGGAYSTFKSKVSVAPTFEPVTIEEAKAWMRVTFTNDDALIASLIKQAREIAERYTGRKFANQTLIGYADLPAGDSLSYADWDGYKMGPVSMLGSSLGFIEFDWGPVNSVTSMETVDIDNNENAYAAANYYLENYDDDQAQRIQFNNDATPPGALRRRNAWKATYVAGYGATQADIPAGIQTGVKMLVSHLYNNRGACGESCVGASGAMESLDSYRMLRL